jgi:NADH dehydrogenase/NADH:ubiquinone oxidoreductase subunit G
MEKVNNNIKDQVQKALESRVESIISKWSTRYENTIEQIHLLVRDLELSKDEYMSISPMLQELGNGIRNISILRAEKANYAHQAYMLIKNDMFQYVYLDTETFQMFTAPEYGDYTPSSWVLVGEL